MIINLFLIRKYAAILLTGCISVVLFFIGLNYYGMLGGIGFWILGLVLAVLLGNILLKNPFTQMLEGKGLLAINIDSTGILRPFIIGVNPPYVQGKAGKDKVHDVFDRAAVMQLAVPRKIKTPAETTDQNGLKIDLTETQYNEGRFALFHYPVIIWNNQIKSIITKDWFSNQEKEAFAEHMVLYLNRKMEELTSVVRDFGRHVIENLKPKQGLGTKGWIMILIGGLIIILLALFAPAIFQALGKATSGSGGIFQGLQGAVTPQP